MFTKRPLLQPFRVHYPNSEFTLNGYAGAKYWQSTSGRPHLPDPAEAVWVLAAKNAKTPSRDRLYVDVPGTNLTRGLSGATMKSAEEHELQIPKTTHMQICKDMKAVALQVESS